MMMIDDDDENDIMTKMAEKVTSFITLSVPNTVLLNEK